MASNSAPVPVDAAEKAYAAAAESVTEKPVAVEAATEVVTEPSPAPVKAPAVDVIMPPKAKRAVKPAPIKVDAPVAVKPATPKAKVKAAPKKKPVAKAKKPAGTAPLSSKAASPKPVSKSATVKAASPVSKLKDKIMATKTKEFTATVKTAFADAQAKAKEGYAKGSVLVSEAVEFTKGNVEAVVESGKIFADGAKKIGEGYVAEAKGAYETVSADMKQMSAVKSPVELVKLQGEIASRNFEQAIALTKKNGEAWMKLASAAFAPIQGRVSLAVEKVKKAA